MIWLALPALASAAYWLLAIVAAIRWGKSTVKKVGETACPTTSVSILKPVHGRDPHFYEAIRSHALQDYPQYEILFGISRPNDPAADDIRRLIAEFPARNMRLIVTSTKMPNAKVGVLADLAAQARYPLLLINDSDIKVEPDYLRQVTPLLGQPHAGLVTCLYRAQSENMPGRWEALGVATEFAPSVLVARLLGQAEFALGSTMAFRAETLRAVGGFEAIAEYLADDYQLGRRISAAGGRIVFAPVVVETDLGAESWRQTWRHQVRWARTIRVSRPGGYFGYAVTHATVWAGVACAAGQWWCAAAALALRLTAGALAGAVLQDRYRAGFWLMPLRDLFGFAVWIAGATGNTVHWRDRNLKLLSNGRIAAPR